jgi:hypothetical protein
MQSLERRTAFEKDLIALAKQRAIAAKRNATAAKIQDW